MRLSLRFIVPLLLVLAAFAYAVLPLVDGLTVRWFMRDLDIRATLIANTVREPIENSIRYGDEARVLQALTRITEDERVYRRRLQDRLVTTGALGPVAARPQEWQVEGSDPPIVFRAKPDRRAKSPFYR